MLERLKMIIKKIDAIETIVARNSGITNALSDEIQARPAILMHLVSMAEQFQKLQESMELEILSQFDKEDVRGAFAVRNFIAHDYEGVNDAIIENVIRDYLPKIKKTALKIIGKSE